MPDPPPDPDLALNAAEVGGGLATVPESLRPLVERQRALQQAWGVIAPSCLSSQGREIVDAGRAASQALSELSQQSGGPDDADLRRLEARLDGICASICAVAFELPISQLRSTLPACVRSDRRGLLDLLDLLAGSAFEEPGTLGSKLATIDYLITLLCTGGDPEGRNLEDPVLLTPTFRALTRRAEAENETNLAEIESEFFAVANLETDLRDEVQLRSLRARKADLGMSYFAPSMLRAILTYNVALLQCVAAEVFDSRDWGGGAEPAPEPSGGGVFESEFLDSLREAVVRRIENRDPETGPIGRVAWALDLDYANASEKSLLTHASDQTPDLKGTVVLVGLVCRSLNVLSIELQDIGIDPNEVADRWVEELDGALKARVNERIASDDYRESCVISELRTKFLYAPMLDANRENRRPVPSTRQSPPASDERQVRRAAKELASDALAQDGTARAGRVENPPGRTTWRDLSFARMAPAGLGLLAALLLAMHGLGIVDLVNSDLERWSDRELETVSPHLVRGHRNGDGLGHAFVGTIDEEWLNLDVEPRRAAAEQLVAALREQGVAQVMIYDRDDRLRIQALGDRVRIPSSPQRPIPAAPHDAVTVD